MGREARENHYQLLGLDLSATSRDIEGAVERLSERADELAYTSPDRSRELWARIRQVRRDLLSGGERRYAYDSAIVDGWDSAPEPRDPHEETPAALAAPTLVPDKPAVAGKRRSLFGFLLGGGVMIVLAASLVAWWSNRPTSRSTNAHVHLTVRGLQNGLAYASGQHVTLGWSPVPHADMYHLQIATGVGGGISHALFQHPAVSVQTPTTWYSVPVIGAQTYVWRVQAYVDGHWTRYTAPRSFQVGLPLIGRPRPLSPADGSAMTSSRVQLCWSSVPGAVGYRLRIRRIGGMNVQGTCRWETLSPGSYRWTIAALVKGARVYRGPYSNRTYFSVVPVLALSSKSRRHTRRSSHAVPASVHTKAVRAPLTTGRSRTVVRPVVVSRPKTGSNVPVQIAAASPVVGSANVSRTAAKPIWRRPKVSPVVVARPKPTAVPTQVPTAPPSPTPPPVVASASNPVASAARVTRSRASTRARSGPPVPPTVAASARRQRAVRLYAPRPTPPPVIYPGKTGTGTYLPFPATATRLQVQTTPVPVAASPTPRRTSTPQCSRGCKR